MFITELDVKSQSLKPVICSFCKLPPEFAIIPLDNDNYICERCINNSEIMNQFKLNNDILYNKIIDEYNKMSKRNKSLMRPITDNEIEIMILTKNMEDSELNKYFFEHLNEFII